MNLDEQLACLAFRSFGFTDGEGACIAIVRAQRSVHGSQEVLADSWRSLMGIMTKVMLAQTARLK